MRNQLSMPRHFASALVALSFGLIQENANPASWAANGPMSTERYFHTATLLQNGQVLITGGLSDSGHLASADLYDPATGKCTASGSMTNARRYHTATLLPNGKVLVAGGQLSDYSVTGSVELYDPASGTWTSTGSLTNARYVHTATLLPNGKVLVTGGRGSGGRLASAELYDPATGRWSPTGSLGGGRYGHTATLLTDGRVLAAGGYDDFTSGSLPTTELYNPTNGFWTSAGALTDARDSHTATLLPNGKVMVAGGLMDTGGSKTRLTSVELFDSASGTWTGTGSLNTAREFHSATLLPDGKVLVAGGQGNSGSLSTAQLYDPNAGTWTTTSALTTNRSAHTATLLPSGRVLVTGGEDNIGNLLAGTEVYEWASATWTGTAAVSAPRRNHTATMLPDGQVLIAGGFGSNGATNRADIFNPATGVWTPTGSLITAREWHTATLLADGRVLFSGGSNSASGFLTSAELHDPTVGTNISTGTMPIGRREHTATLLPDGRVLVAGGQASSGITNSAQLFDPTNGTWTTTGSLGTRRKGHTATLLPNGKVLVAGGTSTSGVTNRAELYDPESGTWTPTGSLTNARTAHTATLLPNGKVLVAGGIGINGVTNRAELYDITSGIWTVTGSMINARSEHTATLLPNGSVLITGGVGNSSITNRAEVYVPATGTWSTTSPLSTARAYHTATLLPNGKVMVVGGAGTSGLLSSTELYDPGLSFSNSWQPQIATVNSPLALNGNLTLTGSKLRGVSGASSGQGQDSATDYPLVQLRSLENERSAFLLAANWSTNSFASVPATNFPVGHYLVTVFVNGIPGTSSVVRIDTTPPATAPQATTLAATSVGASNATLNATVNPGGVSTTVYFQYGLTTNYSSVTTASNLPAGSTNVNVSTSLSGLTPGTMYHFRVVATNAVGTNAGGNLTFVTAPLAPQVTTLAATSIGVSNATLNATVNPGGASTTVYFQYGLTTNYGSVTTASNLPAGLTNVSVSTSISGLTPGTVHHFRVVATNAVGTNAGGNLTFVTAPLPPQATTLAATSIGVSNATLNATVNPGGAATAVYFQYGLTTNYGSVTTISNLAAGLNNVNLSTTISGLTPGTLYHYRVIATNSAATNAGFGLTFTTLFPTATPPKLMNLSWVGDTFQFTFTNTPGAPFTVLFTTNVAQPLSNWTALGSVTEVSPGQFQFTDSQAAGIARRFYLVRSP